MPLNQFELDNWRAWINPRRKRFWATILLLAYTLGGFLLVPWAIQHNFTDLTRQFLSRDGSIEKVSFNPWTLRLQINGFTLRDGDADGTALAGLDELIVNLQVRSLFQLALVFDEISLQRPKINLRRYAINDTNLGRMIIAMDEVNKEQADEETATGSGLRLIIDNLRITDGIVNVQDDVPNTAFNTSIEPINISVSNFSTLPDQTGEQRIDVTTETGAALSWTGTLQIAPLVSKGTISLTGSPVALVYRYFSDQLGFRFQDCCMDVALNYALAGNPDGDFSVELSNLNVSSRELEIRALESDEIILRLPELRLTNGQLAWPEQSFSVGEILLAQPEVNVWISSDGQLNLNRLIPAQTNSAPNEAVAEISAEDAIAETDTEAEAAGTESDIAAKMGTEQETVDQQPVTADVGVPDMTAAASEPGVAAAGPGAEEAWDINIDSVHVEGLNFSFSDRTLAEPGVLKIPTADFRLSDISNRANARAGLALTAQIGESGSLALNGDVALLPTPDVVAELNIADVDLPVLQPWLQQFAQIKLTEGAFNYTGTLGSTAKETVELRGDIAIRNLAVSDTLEGAALVGWQQLGLNQLQLQLDAGRLNISEITLDKPYTRLIIAADGTTNFQALATDEANEQPVGDTPPREADSSTMEKPFVVGIGRTLIKDGAIDFSDFSLPLPFSVAISEFGGNVAALASNSKEPSTIDLEGKVGQFGFVGVGGSVSATEPLEQTSINVDFRNISMPDLSPYTAEFAGRKISSGKLDLDLDYSFKQRKMQGANKIVLEKFELGERIDSPDAMDLPLDLAISLLTDANGVIDLQLDVSGDMDDPKFSAGGIILKAFVNLITKAVTAPFKLLAGLLPGGGSEDLDAIEFPPGRADLLPPEREKIAELKTALEMRPNLVLGITAGFNREADSDALRVMALQAQVDALSGADTNDADQELLTSRTRKALEKLAKTNLPDLSLRDLGNEYQLQSDPSGRTGLDEVAYMAELRRRLEAAQPVTEDELVTLAENRQASISRELSGSNARAELGKTQEVKMSDADMVRIELTLDAGSAAQPDSPASNADGDSQ